VIFLDGRIAERGLDPPHAEHERRLDTKIFFDAGEERRVLLGLLLAGRDLPVGGGAIEILPELLIELRLIMDRLQPGGVRLNPAHDARVRIVRDAVRDGLRAKRLDPPIERRFRARRFRHDQARKGAGDGL
jgi:hypothetical protein